MTSTYNEYEIITYICCTTIYLNLYSKQPQP